MPDSLWGPLPEPDARQHPRELLNQQARILSEETKGVIQAKVTDVTPRISSWDDACLRFSLVCPSIGNYSYEVASIYYKRLEIFPIYIVPPGADLGQTPVDSAYSGVVTADSDDQYRNAVAMLLQSERVKRVIAALLREANALASA
jgi:hypothetical protein